MKSNTREERREIGSEKVEKKAVSAIDVTLVSVLQMHCSYDWVVAFGHSNVDEIK
jgi:hypothetical protein